MTSLAPDDQGDARYARRNLAACRSCGVTVRARGGTCPLGWTILGSGSKLKGYMCPACVRKNLRDIEGKLDLDFEA